MLYSSRVANVVRWISMSRVERTVRCAVAFVFVFGAPVVAQERDSVPRAVPASADGAPGGPETAAVVSRVRALLDAEMPVTASQMLARELSLGVIDGFDAVVLAARAHAEQRSWVTVRRLLIGRDWTDPTLESEARLLLAAAYRGLDSASRAAETYQAYLDGATEQVPAVVRVDFARALLGADRPAEAAEQLGTAAREFPDIARWARLSRLNALVRARDTTAFALADSLARTPLVPADSAWRAAAELAFRLDAPERGVAFARPPSKLAIRPRAIDDDGFAAGRYQSLLFQDFQNPAGHLA